jgi:hypothetical protein
LFCKVYIELNLIKGKKKGGKSRKQNHNLTWTYSQLRYTGACISSCTPLLKKFWYFNFLHQEDVDLKSLL